MQKRNKYIFILLGVGALLLLTKKAKAMSFKFTNFKKAIASKLITIQSALIELGLTETQLKLVLAQVLFETGAFTRKSRVAELNNNFSGIKYICRPSVQKNASKGSPVPPTERVKPDDICYNFYAKFPTFKDWAVDYVRILSLKRTKNKIGRPIDAENVNEFVKRLKLNDYFGSNEESYAKGVKYYFDLLI